MPKNIAGNESLFVDGSIVCVDKVGEIISKAMIIIMMHCFPAIPKYRPIFDVHCIERWNWISAVHPNRLAGQLYM